MTTDTNPPSDSFDYLYAEQFIYDTLRAKVPGLRDIVRERSGSDAEALQVTSPGAVIYFAGHSFPQQSGKRVKVVQVFCVALVANVPNDHDGSQTAAVLGPLIPQVVRALSGEQVNDSWDFFELLDPPNPTHLSGSERFIPLLFKTGFVL